MPMMERIVLPNYHTSCGAARAYRQVVFAAGQHDQLSILALPDRCLQTQVL